eukprot:12122-Heterococcus_DN1.PRE.5
MYSKPAHPLFEHVIDLILDAQHAKHCSKSAGKSLTREELTAVWTTVRMMLGICLNFAHKVMEYAYGSM